MTAEIPARIAEVRDHFKVIARKPEEIAALERLYAPALVWKVVNEVCRKKGAGSSDRTYVHPARLPLHLSDPIRWARAEFESLLADGFSKKFAADFVGGWDSHQPVIGETAQIEACARLFCAALTAWKGKLEVATEQDISRRIAELKAAQLDCKNVADLMSAIGLTAAETSARDAAWHIGRFLEVSGSFPRPADTPYVVQRHGKPPVERALAIVVAEEAIDLFGTPLWGTVSAICSALLERSVDAEKLAGKSLSNSDRRSTEL